MTLRLRVWRQEGPKVEGKLCDYDVEVTEDMSFLEMFDVLNEKIMRDPERYPEGPIAFDHDCREGICGTCSMVIDGVAHGPRRATRSRWSRFARTRSR
jgi:succinate dehydrogenase / fumarate reductase iron-sulfur subunit